MSRDHGPGIGADGRFRFTPEQRARLERIRGDEAERRALADPDNPPLTEEMLARMTAGRAARIARARTGLSQAAFAKRFRIGLARLRDLEQGRYNADNALLAYLKVIETDPDAVTRALDTDVA